jgi:hypothetical protein
VLANGCVKTDAVTGRELVVCLLIVDWAMESAPVLSLGVTMHQDIIMHAVCTQYVVGTYSSTSKGPRVNCLVRGATVLHLAMLRHESVTTVAGTSTPVITTSGNAPMTP